MKNKEKLDLLLKDLSSRLPFRVKIEFSDGSVETLKGIWYDEDEGWQVDGENTSTCLHAVKPFLLPLSSMTEEQKIIYGDLVYAIVSSNPLETQKCISELYDWYNKNHFDYRGDLIGEDDNGIALDATGLNIY